MGNRKDKEGREVDFAVIRDGKLEGLIEAKYSDENISRGLRDYTRKLQPFFFLILRMICCLI